jgi:hypothetical protein
MIVTFLFWNLYGRHEASLAGRKKALETSIMHLGRTQQVDVFLFAECPLSAAEVEAALDGAGVGLYRAVPAQNARVRFFSRLPQSAWRESGYRNQLNDRISAQRLRLKGALPILVIGAHLHDRLAVPTDVGRAGRAGEVARDIIEMENLAGHQRTVLVGDLNMNPYEGGVVVATSLHGLISRRLAGTVQRMGRRARYPCFYNPMWGLLGDGNGRPGGTYFFNNSMDPANHFWNVYDQVLLRPDLMDGLADVQILVSDGVESLLTREGRPRKGTVSDHLPVLFRLDL